MIRLKKSRDRVCFALSALSTKCPCPDKGHLHRLSLQNFAILLIKLYQNTFGFVFPQSCRFYPTCSEYSIQALKRRGFLKGSWLSLRRLLKCHPFTPGGYDPVK